MINSFCTRVGNTEGNTAAPFIRDCCTPDMTLHKDYSLSETLD